MNFWGEDSSRQWRSARSLTLGGESGRGSLDGPGSELNWGTRGIIVFLVHRGSNEGAIGESGSTLIPTQDFLTRIKS